MKRFGCLTSLVRILLTYDIRHRVRTYLQKPVASLVKNTPMEACIRVEFDISSTSSLVQYITVYAHLPYIIFNVNVKWEESHKFLKVF